MKNHINIYAKLLIEELQSGAEVRSSIERLKEILQNRRHQTLLPAILRKAKSTILEAPNHLVPTLVVASEDDVKKYAAAIEKELQAKIHIDPTIIGGYQTIQNLNLIDNSYKSKLLKWYRSAVTK